MAIYPDSRNDVIIKHQEKCASIFLYYLIYHAKKLNIKKIQDKKLK